MLLKSCLKIQNLQYKLLSPNTPLELFQKFIRFGGVTRPLLQSLPTILEFRNNF